MASINGETFGKYKILSAIGAGGKLADIVVLSKDILTVPEEEIPSATVVYTIVGGKIEYRVP